MTTVFAPLKPEVHSNKILKGIQNRSRKHFCVTFLCDLCDFNKIFLKPNTLLTLEDIYKIKKLSHAPSRNAHLKPTIVLALAITEQENIKITPYKISD